ncbi:MAG: DUF3526 domain-containing protein [Sphingobacteriia bacterium]|nr:MAG: DUF3526 domain-containing protein [Sphingobacteriia bacterium]
MISKIISHEWLQWRRDSRLKWLAIFLVVISAFALWHQINFQSTLLKKRLKAQEDSRQEWLSQELKHPHMAAHFGNYAYKKPTLLHCFDPGLTIYTGTSVYMEPHKQNDFLFSQSQESDTGIRFGWLSPAMICQLILPLLIILLSFNSINGEYEKGTMALLISQGANFRSVLIAKTASVFLFFEGFITLYLLVTAYCSAVYLGTVIDIYAVLYIWIVYSLYCFIWSLSGVLVSSLIKSSGTSIALLLLLWMFTNIILPRGSANIAENMHPLITNQQFKQLLTASIDKGIDGHDPKNERAKKIEKELLLQYKVDSVQQLPFNFEGFIMQQSEAYSSKVYDHHFNQLFTTLKQQKKIQSLFGIISPYISLRNISMAAANASLETEIDFQQQAEHYRRSFVQNMNNDMKDNSAYGSFKTYRVRKDKYASIGDLQVQNRTMQWSIPTLFIEHISLLLWVLFLMILLFISNQKKVYN